MLSKADWTTVIHWTQKTKTKAGVPSLPEFPGVSWKRASILRLAKLEQDLPEVKNQQLFHDEITTVHKICTKSDLFCMQYAFFRDGHGPLPGPAASSYFGERYNPSQPFPRLLPIAAYHKSPECTSPHRGTPDKAKGEPGKFGRQRRTSGLRTDDAVLQKQAFWQTGT